MRATPRSAELHSIPAIASRGSSSLPPAGWHSTAPRRMPSKRYRSAAVKSASDPGLCGTGNALGSGVATARGVATGGTEGATGRSDGDGEGPMLEAPHAATATAATSDATRMSRDICLISEMLAVDERPLHKGDACVPGSDWAECQQIDRR